MSTVDKLNKQTSGATAARQGISKDLMEVGQVVEAIRKRWPLVVAVITAVLALGVIYTLRAPKLYQAIVSIVISRNAPQVLTGVQELTPMGSGAYWDEAFLQTEYKIIGSRTVALRAAKKLNLLMDDRHNGLDKIQDPKLREEKRKSLDVAKLIEDSVEIVPVKRSQLVTLEVVNSDAKFAAALANAMATSYMEYNVEKRMSGTAEASTWLSVQHEDLKKKLASSEDDLYAFMAKKGILNASLESQMDEVKSRLTQFIGKLAEVQAQRIAGQVNGEALKRVYDDPGVLDSLTDVQNALVINTMKGKLMEAMAMHSDLASKYLPDHPKMVGLQDQIASLQRSLKKEVDATIKRLERDQISLAKTEEGLNAAVSRERSREAAMNRLGLEYGRLKRDVETNSKLYEMVTTRLKEIGLTGMMQINNVHLLDTAEVPRKPYRPSWPRNLGLSLLVGLLLSLGLAWLLEMLDTSLKTQDEVEKFLGLPFLGVMPIIQPSTASKSKAGTKSKRADNESIRERDLYVLHNPKSMAAECSRAIRTNLLFMSPDNPLKTFIITSAMPREGKTTTAVNLAATMAQTGSRVLIVDTDLRKPRIHKSFGLPNDVGVSSIIVGETRLEDAIRHSELPGLDVLTCGPIPPNPAELLHTAKFQELLTLLKSKYDKVIFDAPPVGAVTDPVILGTQVDGVILIAKTGYTAREMVVHAVRTLEDARVHLLGVILNDMDISAKKYGYYYGKYYRYGRYYGQYGETTGAGQKAS